MDLEALGGGVLFWGWLWPSCMAVAAAIGHRKAAAIDGLLAGLLLGPLGVVAALGLDNRPRCLNCASTIDPLALVCPWCQDRNLKTAVRFLSPMKVAFAVLVGILVFLVVSVSLSTARARDRAATDSRERDEAMTAATRDQLDALKVAIDRYYADVGRSPTNLRYLREGSTVEENKAKFKGPYTTDEGLDAWGTPIDYVRESITPFAFRLVSAGADQGFGTLDDIEVRGSH